MPYRRVRWTTLALVLSAFALAAPAQAASPSFSSSFEPSDPQPTWTDEAERAQGVTGPDQAAWIAEVLRLNNIADARLLAAGQELSLPRSTATTSTTPRPGTTTTAGSAPTRAAGTPTSGAATATPRPAGTPGAGGTYTVVSGDSPNGIATKVGVPAAQQQAWVLQMLQLNNVTAQTLQIGQVLQLPPIPR